MEHLSVIYPSIVSRFFLNIFDDLLCYLFSVWLFKVIWDQTHMKVVASMYRIEGV